MPARPHTPRRRPAPKKRRPVITSRSGVRSVGHEAERAADAKQRLKEGPVPAPTVTRAMKRAGAEVLQSAPELYPEELAELVYRAMAAKGGA
jgi:hypothetical protein